MVKTSLTLYSIRSVCSFIESGKIVTPAFQRGFVWSKKDVLDFLTSIYKGYPVGTITMLEEVPSRFNALSLRDFSPLASPKNSPYHSLWYVLDGTQRLSALYRSLFSQDTEFAFAFNLESEEFITKSKVGTLDSFLELQSLYSAKSYLQFQRSLFTIGEEYELLLDKAKRLHDTFNEYQLPVQVLADITLEDAASIFQIINTSGKHLRKSDIEEMWRDIG